MDIMGLLIFLVIGALAGWLAGTIMKGGGFGLLGNIIIGIVGGVVGGFLFNLLAIAAARKPPRNRAGIARRKRVGNGVAGNDDE